MAQTAANMKTINKDKY